MNASFVENIAAGVDALGVTYAPIIYSLAQIQWETPDERDSVLSFLGGNSGT